MVWCGWIGVMSCGVVWFGWGGGGAMLFGRFGVVGELRSERVCAGGEGGRGGEGDDFCAPELH